MFDRGVASRPDAKSSLASAGGLLARVDAVCRELTPLARGSAGVTSGAPTAVLLDAAAGLEAAATLVSLAQARVLAALTIVDPVSHRLFPPVPDADLGPSVPGPEQTSTHEVAAALRGSAKLAESRLATAAALAGMPLVTGAATDGLLRWWQVRRVAEVVADLSPPARTEVDRRIAADAIAGRCARRFGARLERAVLAADPARTEQLHDEAVGARRVGVRPVPAGMAWFGACLPVEDCLAVGRCLDELAATDISVPPGDWPGDGLGVAPEGRTAAQRRADALVGLAHPVLAQLHVNAPVGLARGSGDPRSDPRSGSGDSGRGARAGPDSTRPRARRRGEVLLVVSAETVLGISSAPAELRGYGPIGAGQARRIAHLAGMTWRRVVTDPVSGVVLDYGRTTYAPPAPLADHVLARFGWQCTRPGCSHSARDLDHATPWHGVGTTSADNLHPTCRGCHTAKHRAGGSASTATGRQPGLLPTVAQRAPRRRTCDPRTAYPAPRTAYPAPGTADRPPGTPTGWRR